MPSANDGILIVIEEGYGVAGEAPEVPTSWVEDVPHPIDARVTQDKFHSVGGIGRRVRLADDDHASGWPTMRSLGDNGRRGSGLLTSKFLFTNRVICARQGRVGHGVIKN
jgi:hypothetical protein